MQTQAALRGLSSTAPSDAEVARATDLIKSNNIDTVVVAFPDMQGRLMGKRYDAGDFLANAVGSGAHGCAYLFAVDIGMNPLPGFKFVRRLASYFL